MTTRPVAGGRYTRDPETGSIAPVDEASTGTSILGPIDGPLNFTPVEPDAEPAPVPARTTKRT